MSPIELSLGPYGALCGCYTQFSIGLYRILAGHEKKFAVAAYLLYPYFFYICEFCYNYYNETSIFPNKS